eukprot:1486369-Lingulodinium_polyedra.AAC.1
MGTGSCTPAQTSNRSHQSLKLESWAPMLIANAYFATIEQCRRQVKHPQHGLRANLKMAQTHPLNHA